MGIPNKKGVSVLLVLLMVFSGLNGLLVGGVKTHAAAAFAGGTGTKADPYQIANAEQLNEVRYHNFVYFKLIDDIDLSDYAAGEGWLPIVHEDYGFFSGSFDGNGFKIKNLVINRPESDWVGLFGHAIGSELSNIILENVQVTGNNLTGGLAGENQGTISHCSVAGSVTGNGNLIGGLTGSNTNGEIIASSSAATVSGNDEVGGLAGYNQAVISNSYATGNVSGADLVGGLIGNNSEVKYSYATGKVEGTGNEIGGLAGRNGFGQYVGIITHSFYDSTTTGRSESGKGTGLDTADMKLLQTYTDADWDFSGIWEIDSTRNEGYPYLKALPAADIAGVTAPVTGASPLATLVETAAYTAAIAWSPAHATFASGTVYTATLTLTPKVGYTVTGVSANFFKVAGATTTNEANAAEITAVFPATETTIATANIAGATAPVTGATPVATLADTTAYTATVTWSPADAAFAADTVYTATLTLMPKTGYTLTGVPADFFKVAGATTTNVADAGVITAVFPATAALSTPPTNTNTDAPASAPVALTEGRLTIPAGKSDQVSLSDEVTVFIPAGATDREMSLTIEKVLNTQSLLTNKEVLLSSIYEILKNFTENFNKPVTLTFVFDPASLKSNQRAVVFYYDEVNKVWVEVGGTVSGNRITASVSHFTKFAVMAVEAAAEIPVTDTTTKVDIGDISGHWAEAAIRQAVSGGIVKGYPDDTFKPDKTVTRAEFSVMLMNVLKPQEEGAELTFTDSVTIGSWAQKAVAQAVQAGIIQGYEDGTFRPNAAMTRAEVAVMIANTLDHSIEANAETGFADDKDIPAWAKNAVGTLKKLGLMEGKGMNTFDPHATTTRAEAVTVLLQMLAQRNTQPE